MITQPQSTEAGKDTKVIASKVKAGHQQIIAAVDNKQRGDPLTVLTLNTKDTFLSDGCTLDLSACLNIEVRGEEAGLDEIARAAQ